MLDSRSKGCGFEPHWRHCLASLNKTLFLCLVLVPPRNTCPDMTKKLLLGNQNKQTLIMQNFIQREARYSLEYNAEVLKKVEILVALFLSISLSP